MLDTAQALLEKIRLGEDSFLELKEVVFSGSKIRGPHREELADEMTAFANARGGVIVLVAVARRHRQLPVSAQSQPEQLDHGGLARTATADQGGQPGAEPDVQGRHPTRIFQFRERGAA